MEQAETQSKLTSNSTAGQRVWILVSMMISGFCWYYANELSGDFGYLMWVAPIAVILCSLYTHGKTTFIMAFLAYGIGRLSWFSYLVSVITLVPTLLFTLIVSLIFAFIIVVTRRIVIKTNAWYSVFAFPIFFTTFEFLLLKFSPDGTAGSIAYSQSDYLPVVQIASVTGILGITFLITLVPSALALGWYFRKEKGKLRFVLGTGSLITLIVFLFGTWRLTDKEYKQLVKVGLVVLDEKFHDITDSPIPEKEKLSTALYCKEITVLALQGAKIIVLPERAVNINKETEQDILNAFSQVAKERKVYIIAGYTNFRSGTARNSAVVFDPQGKVMLDYNKVHLVKVLEDQFTPGDSPGFFKYDNGNTGTAICKDLDFPDYIKRYRNITLLTVPAWDFVADGWLHSRMAVLRGVENGFSEIRTARQGKLSISDGFGRVTDEADCSNGRRMTLLGNVSLRPFDTFYSRFGNWFGVMNLVGLALLVIATWKKSKKGAAR